MQRGYLLVWIVLASCGGSPQTRQEFVRRVAEGAWSTAHDRYVVPRPTADIEQILRAKSTECFGKTIYKRGAGAAPGTQTTTTSTYLAFLEHTADNTLQLTVRVKHVPRGIGSPVDGVFLVAADLKDDGGKTQVNLYAPSKFFDELVTAVRAWLGGDSAPCPELD